jgi:hypothetical protein
MARFIFNANSFGIGGRITRPFEQDIDTQAACVLPSTGGKAYACAPAYRLEDPGSGRLVLAFDSIETSISGDEGPIGNFATIISTSIRNFNVLDVFKADAVNCRYTLNYDLKNRRVAIDADGSQFVNLTIGGEPFDISLDYAMAQDASDFETFKKKHPEMKESKGKINYSLARGKNIKFKDDDYGFVDVPDFGRIYFAEWTAAEDTQSLTMFRMELGSPVGGKVTGGSGGGNGAPFPP